MKQARAFTGVADTRATLPDWVSSQPIGKWITLPDTREDALGQLDKIGYYSGAAFVRKTSEVFIALNGGHNSAVNRVASLDFSAAVPAWQLRSAKSTYIPPDFNLVSTPYRYLYDNAGQTLNPKPVSRHVYNAVHYVEPIDRVMLHGARATNTASGAHTGVDGFCPTTNQWDPPGTWADLPGGLALSATYEHGVGHVYDGARYTPSNPGLNWRWNPRTDTYDRPQTGSDVTSGNVQRYPQIYDPIAKGLFAMQYGDAGENVFGTESWESSCLFLRDAGWPFIEQAMYRRPVEFNASAARTALLALKPIYIGMDYDVVNDVFLLYPGIDFAGVTQYPGLMYVLRPNRAAPYLPWDVETFPYHATNVMPPNMDWGSTLSRFFYVPKLRGFGLVASETMNVQFIRTSA